MLLITLLSCSLIEPYATPADGQSAVALDLPLVARHGAAEVPPDYPIETLIRVIDLADQGYVAGRVVKDGDDLVFWPENGWAAGHRYAWTIGGDVPDPHAPTLPVPDEIRGTAVFSTSEVLDVLSAGLDEDGRLCLVASMPVAELEAVPFRVTVNDVPVADANFVILPHENWVPGVDISDGDPGLGVVCMTSEIEVSAGAEVRVWRGDLGPWRVTVSDADPQTVTRDLYWRVQ